MTSELGRHALSYADLGLEIFPVGRHDKKPIQSQHGATTDLDQIEEWWSRWPTALIGHRIDPGIILLDIDPRHKGNETWRAIKAEMNGDMPTTRTHLSGRGDGGGHVWWIRPAGNLAITKLDRWAKAKALGAPILDDNGKEARWTGGIDLLTHQHRYTILPPSPHPDTQRPYHWAQGKGLTTEPAQMPTWLAEMLRRPEATTPQGPGFRTVDPDSIADWYSANHTLTEILTEARWTLVNGTGDDDGSGWRHPEATSSVSATVRHGCLFVYSTSTPFEPTGSGDPRGYTPFSCYTVLAHAGDASRAAKAARELKRAKEGSGVNQRMTLDPLEGATGSDGTQDPVSSPETGLELVRIEHLEAFWDQLPILAKIRDFARARMCSPWAMLGVVLARVSAAVPPFVVLPPLVGSHLSLNLYVVLVGGSGAGKDAAIGAAADALPFASSNFSKENPRFAEIGLGSGEGILDQYVEWVPPNKATEEEGHFQTITKSVLFTNPEIESVGALKGRSSATLMPMLRDAWMGSKLGFAYRQHQGKRATLDAQSYRLSLILGCQPTSAGVLLDEASVGTPQRFVWLPVHDPQAPDVAPALPEMEDWKLPRGLGQASADGRAVMDLCPEASEAIRNARLERLRGTTSPDSPSGHALAAQEKVAALLAILDGSTEVTLEYWGLAGQLATLSSRTRDNAAEAVSYEAKRKNQSAGKAEAARRQIVRSVDDEQALAKCCQRIKVVLGAKDDWFTSAKVRKAISGPYREFMPEAVDLLLASGDIEQEEREHRGGTGLAYRLSRGDKR